MVLRIHVIEQFWLIGLPIVMQSDDLHPSTLLQGDGLHFSILMQSDGMWDRPSPPNHVGLWRTSTVLQAPFDASITSIGRYMGQGGG